VAEDRIDRLIKMAGEDFAAEMIRFACEPALGARSKRELELKMFELLYGAGLDSASVGDVGRDLAIPRARARNLILDTRARSLANEDAAARARRLRDVLCSWPKTPKVELEAGRLRFVVDDPHVRDMLKSYAYDRGIVVDGSFSGEIVSMTWASWARMITSLLTEAEYKQAANAFATAIRKRIADDDNLEQKVKKDLTQQLKGDPTDPTWLQRAAGIARENAPGLLKDFAIRLATSAVAGG
jgi:hypothetical protein